MNLIKFLPENIPVKGVVIYFHGNMRNLRGNNVIAEEIKKQEKEITMILRVNHQFERAFRIVADPVFG